MDKQKEVVDKWMELYKTLPPLLGEGEKYLSQIADEMGVDTKTAKSWIKQHELAGTIVPIGKRRTSLGKIVDAWKCV